MALILGFEKSEQRKAREWQAFLRLLEADTRAKEEQAALRLQSPGPEPAQPVDAVPEAEAPAPLPETKELRSVTRYDLQQAWERIREKRDY